MKSFTKIIVFTVCGASISLLLVLAIARPVLDDVSATNKLVKQKKNELATLDQQIRAFKTAQSDLARATRKDEIVNIIVPKENLVLAVKDMETAAAKTGTVEALLMKEADLKGPKTPEVISGKQGMEETGYQLTTLNDYNGTINFLAYLEHLPHFTEISKIILSAETQEASNSAPAHTGKIIGSFDGVFFIKTPQ